jgi:hypothetical protein
MDWWLKNPDFTSTASPDRGGDLDELRRRLSELEAKATEAEAR